MSAEVLFSSTKTLMEVDAWGYHTSMLVQPGVATTELEMGVFVRLFEEGKPDETVTTRFWGMVVPRDLITFWRAMLILEKLNILSESDLCNAYYAAQRKPHESDRQKVTEITDKIGFEAYNEVMAVRIPDEVINLVIRLTDEDKPVSLWPITEEVEAGTLDWREDFARIGAKHPKEVAARDVAEKRVINRYERYLIDYAKTHGYPRGCMIMWSIEGVLVDAVERGIEDKYGQDIALGVSIARAHGGTAAFATMFMDMGDEESIKTSVKTGIQQAAKWLQTQFTRGFWHLWSPKRTIEDYEMVITKLESEWENLPVTHPLTA